VAGLNLSRWKCTLPPTFQHRGLACFHWWRAGEGSKGHVAGGESKIELFHFPSCSSIGNQDKAGTTVRRENTRSHSDLDMWNRLAPYVLRLFGRHGPSPVKKKHKKSPIMAGL